ncbi:MAG: type II toxin-antitoxin system Phd/YefM family antitoxin, partial [Thermoanaerobaculia bacterium]
MYNRLVTYTAEQFRERLDEILRQVRAGETVIISQEGEEVAELRAVDALRRLEEQGLLSPPAEQRASLEDVLRELEEMWRTS